MIQITENQKNLLLAYSRSVLGSLLGLNDIAELGNDAIFHAKFGVFVTLKKDDHLRGCIGYISGFTTLEESIKKMTKQAAFSDYRFEPVDKSEFDTIKIEISILSPMKRVLTEDEIIIGEHGLYVQSDSNSAILLPQVATEYKMTKKDFIVSVCQKAGLEDDCFAKYDFFTFSALVFGE